MEEWGIMLNERTLHTGLHCFKDIYKGQAGLLGQVLVVDNLLQERLLQRLSGAAP